MLSLEDFKPLTLDDKPLFDKHYADYPPVHSDNLFSTMISWNGYGHYQYAVIDHHIVISTKIKNRVRFRPPIGEFNQEIHRQVLHLAKKEGWKYPLGVIDRITRGYLEKHFPTLKFIPRRGYFDYVYLAANLAELPGGPYAKIRNRLNKFKKEYRYTTEDISQKNMEEIQDFLHKWCLWKDCASDLFLENEKEAIMYSMAHLFDLGLRGIALRIQGGIEAIAVYEQMTPDTIVVHYEKGSPDFDGIYKAINQETAERVQGQCTYINRESDMNLPGLRQAKMSYRPHHMVEVFTVDKKDIVV